MFKPRLKQIEAGLQKLQSQFYLLSRTFAIVAGSLLAIHYSRLLGPTNRGVISFIMLMGLLSSELGLGSLNLAFRTRGGSNDKAEQQSRTYRKISVVGTVLLAVVVLLATVVYSWSKEFVPARLLIMAYFYALFSIGTHQLFEYLLALHLIILSSYFEILVVASQIIFYFTLYFFLNLSTAVNVILSLCAGYSTVWISFALLNTLQPKTLASKAKKRETQTLLSNAKKLTPQVFMISLIDRLDKLMVALFFSSATLGKYSLATSLIVVLRYIPDAIGKLLIASRFGRIRNFTKNHFLSIGFISLLLLPFASYINNLLILKILGKEWVLGIGIISAVIVSESLRHILVLRLNLRIADGLTLISWRTPITILGGFLLGTLLLRSYIGLLAIPLTASVCFIFLLFRTPKTIIELTH